MDIELYIERLILEGLSLSTVDGAAVSAAVETELARGLAADPGVFRSVSGAAVSRIRAGSFTLSVGGNPTVLGRQVAASVLRSISNA